MSVISVHKPLGMTSNYVLNIIKKSYHKKTNNKLKIGHGGTLDPLASGVLIIGYGSGTKKLSEFLGCQKTYITTIHLGYTSVTDDEEGEKTLISKREPSITEIETVIKTFVGEITQTPPNYSAIHVNGKRAYDLARQGVEFTLKPRQSTIYKNKILDYTYPYLKIKVTVSGGTYIRTLGKDIGENLKVGGYLSELIRTKVNEYKLKDTFALDKIVDYMIN
jgi:tRNA pseudouridine55 synthase